MKKILLLFFIIMYFIPNKCYAFVTDYRNSQFSSNGSSYLGKSIGDPFIIYDNEYYYLYGTGLLNGKRTKDFKKWEKTNDNTSYDFNNRENFWAPEVFKYNGYYYKIFSSFKKGSGVGTIGLASSKNLNSSFTIKTYDILGDKFSNSVIDADILIDGNNQYLYFAEDQIRKNGTPTSSIYGIQIKLSDGDCSVIGDAKFLKTPDTDFEKRSLYSIGGIWNEGPSVIKHNSKYYLMYSSNYWASSDYNVSYVVSDSPLGPYYRQNGSNVLLETYGNTIGPGHNSVFKSSNGELYTVYHIKDTTSQKSNWERMIAFDRLGFIGDKLFVNGPTYASVQSLPSGINNYNITTPLTSNTPNLFNTLNNFSSIGGSQKISANTKININFSGPKRIKAMFLYPGKEVKTESDYTVDLWINGKDAGSKKFKQHSGSRSGISFVGDYNMNSISLSFSKDILLSEIVFIADTPKNITINTKPTKLTYVQNSETLNVTGGKINVNYYNTSTPRVVNITSSMVSGFNNKNLGSQTLTVTYGNLKTKYSVNVIKKKVSSIKVSRGLTKTSYIQNYDKLSLTGGVVTVTYNDKTTKNIPMSSCTVTGFNNKTIGKKTLKISYEGVSTTYDVTIVKKSRIGIEIKRPTKFYYIQNKQNLNVSDGKVIIKYNDGTKSNEIQMTTDMVSGFSNKTPKELTLTVSYSGFKSEFKVKIIKMVTSEKYKINEKKNFIYTKTDTNTNVILNNLKIEGVGSKTIVGNNVIIKNSGLTNTYKLLNITKSDYDLSKDYIYTKISDFNISKIVTNNCTLTNVNNTLEIGYDGEVFNTYKIVSIKSNNYKIYNKWIYIVGSFDKSKITPINSTIIENNGVLEVKYNNQIIDSLKELKIDFGNLKVNNNTILFENNVKYSTFMKNINSSNLIVELYKGNTLVTSGYIEKGMKLKVKSSTYGEIMTYTITDEYVDVSKLGIDENGYVSKYEFGTTYQNIQNDIKTSGSIKFIDNNEKALLSSDIIRTGSKIKINTGTEEKEYTLVVYGDVNGDGEISIFDINEAIKYKDQDKENDCYKEAADVAKDGKIDIFDYNEIIKLKKLQ